LAKPLKIFVQKSEVITRYTVAYRQDFNYKPMERVITTNVFTCKDGAYDDNPNCGWQVDSKGDKIPNSQGFCCNCEFWEILGLSSSQMNRAKNCGNLNFGDGSATASCLRWANLWYSAYEILRNELYYTINVWIYQEGSDIPLATFQLDPSNPIASDPSIGAIAKIVGDYYPAQPAPELNHLFLMIPSRPASDPLVLQGQSTWMLINPSQITFSGLECNKIGVSYSAFQTQPDKCRQVVGSCLQNQLYHLYQDDLDYIVAGKTPRYLLSSRVRDNVHSARASLTW
jgi:hypothetical protein